MTLDSFISLSLSLFLLATGLPARQELHAIVSPTLVSIALNGEILDQREVKYVLSRANEFAGDIALLRKRLADLEYAPALGEHRRFPIDRDVIANVILFNRAYRERLLSQRELYPYLQSIRDALAETEACYKAWDYLRDAKCDYYYVHTRRLALLNLRNAIGEEAYHRGALPDCVPVWRFRQVNVLPFVVNVGMIWGEVLNHVAAIVAHYQLGRFQEWLEITGWRVVFCGCCIEHGRGQAECSRDKQKPLQQIVALAVRLQPCLNNFGVVGTCCNFESMSRGHPDFLNKSGIHSSLQIEAGQTTDLLKPRGCCTAAESSLTSCCEASALRPAMLITSLPLTTNYTRFCDEVAP